MPPYGGYSEQTVVSGRYRTAFVRRDHHLIVAASLKCGEGELGSGGRLGWRAAWGVWH